MNNVHDGVPAIVHDIVHDGAPDSVLDILHDGVPESVNLIFYFKGYF